MADPKLPDPLKRRHLLQDQSGAAAARSAEAYLAAGRTIDAIEFLARAEDTAKLDELRREAIAAGDAFLLRAVVRVTGVAAGSGEWEALAQAAAAGGKDLYAADARRQAENVRE
jgi:hypothetical protein